MGWKAVVGAIALSSLVTIPAATAPEPATLALSVGPQAPRFNSELWLVHSDGRGPRRVVRTTRIDVFDPAWAPDGRRLAYVVTGDPVTGGTGVEGAIVVVDVDGRHRRRLTLGATPAWAPDGRTIAFSRSSSAGPVIWLVRPNGTGRRRLTTGVDPAWSPDGRRLAFSRDGWIYVVNRGGGGARQVTAVPPNCDMPDPQQGGTDLDPDWSPDGRRIAFVRTCDERSGGTLDRIMTVGVERKDVRELTGGPADGSPSWSPDGRVLAFVRVYALYSIRSDGTHTRRLFAPRGHVVYEVAWLRRRLRPASDTTTTRALGLAT